MDQASVSSSGSYEVFDDSVVEYSWPAQASPQLSAILDKYRSSLKEGSFDHGTVVSIMDDFTMRGNWYKSILCELERASMEAMTDAAQVSALNNAMDPSTPACYEEDG